ncbi:MAG: response regulator [Desulfobacteraceae bacterium]|nr:MAG: response regulator [Desulfobacteraceae bacterium]
MPKKILIVDDDPDVRLFLSTLINDHGFIALEAVDGHAGIETAKAEKPSLILLDLMMPKKSGIAMLADLKKEEALRNIPVIMVTGVTGETGMDLKGFFAKGSFLPAGILEKPIDPETLIEEVKKALGEPHV